MLRATTAACLLVFTALYGWAQSTPGESRPHSQPVDFYPRKLQRLITFPGIDNPKTTLHEALDRLGKESGLVFDVNERTFKFENVMDVLKTQIADPNPIPAMENVRADQVLDRILSRIPTPSGATWIVRKDRVEITTGQVQQAEIWEEFHQGPFYRLVHLAVKEQALADVLNDLASQADVNIVLDRRVSDRARIAITFRVTNAPLDTVLRLLTEMVDLEALAVNNVIFVTTKANAQALAAKVRAEKEQARVKKRLQEQLMNPVDEGDAQAISGLGPFRDNRRTILGGP
jgi:hypothetical protein